MGRRIEKRDGSPRARVGELRTRRADFSDRSDPAFVCFGGTTLYAKNSTVLDAAIHLLKETVLWASGEHLILPRASLNKLVREELAEELDRSVVGAVIGRLLSLGEIETLACLSVNSLTFTALVRS